MWGGQELEGGGGWAQRSGDAGGGAGVDDGAAGDVKMGLGGVDVEIGSRGGAGARGGGRSVVEAEGGLEAGGGGPVC